ncbi:MAG: AAA family ATPase [Caldilineaceae bacterium]
MEGVPGLAKTMAVKTLAEAIGGQFQRIQFTPDLVPADLIGAHLQPEDGRLQHVARAGLHQLAPGRRDQPGAGLGAGALLEVMQERQVTIGRDTHKVPNPFLVMATQNPIESEGTYHCPRLRWTVSCSRCWWATPA